MELFQIPIDLKWIYKKISPVTINLRKMAARL
jgi:hypothetical protein